MLKLAGAAAVLFAFSWCGIHRCGWYARRLDCLLTWQNALLEGERMLCDLGESTPAYLEQLREAPGLGAMAERCLHRLAQEERLELAWCGAVEESAFPLTVEEKRTILSLGTVLGRYDAQEQRQALYAARQRLEVQIVRAEEEKVRLGRMWSVLGISAGVLAVVLLY